MVPKAFGAQFITANFMTQVTKSRFLEVKWFIMVILIQLMRFTRLKLLKEHFEVTIREFIKVFFILLSFFSMIYQSK